MAETLTLKQLFVFLGIFLAVIAFVLIALMNTDTFNTKRFEEKNGTVQENNSTGDNAVSKKDHKEDIQSSNAPLDLSVECRKGVNVEKPECVKWFNDLSKNGSSLTATGVQTVSYNSNKPYEFEYQPQVQPTDFPRMSGVVKLSSGRLMAIDQQGNYMTGISQEDCKKYLSGYRPFDYFALKQNNDFNPPKSSSSDSTSTQQVEQEEHFSTQNPQPKSEPIPYGTKPQKDITGAHSL